MICSLPGKGADIVLRELDRRRTPRFADESGRVAARQNGISAPGRDNAGERFDIDAVAACFIRHGAHIDRAPFTDIESLPNR